jgi:hypothetical protein
MKLEFEARGVGMRLWLASMVNGRPQWNLFGPNTDFNPLTSNLPLSQTWWEVVLFVFLTIE